MNIVSYLEGGEGYPLILIHGFCETREIWTSFAGPLSSKFRVMRPDLPGFGQSPMISKNFSLDDVAATMLDWIQPWRNPPPVVIGHSLGGYVTLSMASQCPEILAGIGLFHSSAYPDTEEKKENRNRVISFVERDGVDAYTGTFVPGLFYQKRNRNIPEVHKMAAKTSLETLIGYTSAMRDRPSSVEVLKTFNKPVLFIAGEKDLLVPPDLLLEQSQMALEPVFHSLAGSGHMGMLESPEEAQKIVGEFVNLSAKFSAR
jgi:pimeloyl-ACP methyl ester carboxylesterase